MFGRRKEVEPVEPDIDESENRQAGEPEAVDPVIERIDILTKKFFDLGCFDDADTLIALGMIVGELSTIGRFQAKENDRLKKYIDRLEGTINEM